MAFSPLTLAAALPLIDEMSGETLHTKRVRSLTGAAIGVMEAGALGIHAIGTGLAAAQGGQTKHAIKQVDRLLSNPGFNVWELFAQWVPYVVGASPDIVVALDWTMFDADAHATVTLHLVTRHGRSTPLVWMTVPTATLKGRQSEYEDTVLTRFHEVLPPSVTVTLLADRGFGDQQLYALLTDLGFRFVIRFRGNIQVRSATGETRPAAAWVPSTGRARTLSGATVTADAYALDAVVCVQARRMKQAWCLAVRGSISGADAVRLYGRRFTIEEAFRHQGSPLRPRLDGDAYPRSLPPRPSPADCRDGHDPAHPPRGGGRESGDGSDAQGQHGQDADAFALPPRLCLLCRNPQHAHAASHAADPALP
jgi:hypothetical protein